MSSLFGSVTLEKFEEAAASIPLRRLDRAFDDVAIAAGEDPGGPVGSRRSRFRCYVATIDQRDPAQRDRLGAALGALIAEVATSKVEFLTKTAERDGFAFENGVFREADVAAPTAETTIVRVGDGLGVRLPAALLKALGLHEGDAVTIRRTGDALTIERSSSA